MSSRTVFSTFARLVPAAVCAAALVAAGCGDGGDKKKEESPAKPVEKTEKPTEVESSPIGVESPRAFSYVYGKGSKDFKAAEKLLKEEARDWKAIAESARAAIKADKNHYGAHRLLGIALANTGENAEAAKYLSNAIAADWMRWGSKLEEDKSLTEFLETPEGKGLLEQNAKYKAQFEQKVAESVLVVAKRTKWKQPTKTGKQWAASRAELFAYHLDDERYLRLTHTGESLVGFVKSPSNDQIAVLAVTHYEFPEKDASGSAPSFSPIASARVLVLDGKTYQEIGKPARLKKKAEWLALYYGAGEELQLDAGGTVYSVDYEGGKLKKSSAKGLGEFEDVYNDANRKTTVLFSNSKFSRVLRPWPVALSGKKAVKLGDKSIELPDGGGDEIRRAAVSESKGRVTIVGVGDPCAKDHQSAIYVADAESGALKHVHRGAGLQDAAWLDDNRFIFESEPGELRVYDASTKNTTHTIKNSSGISLSAVSNTVSGEHCDDDSDADPHLDRVEPAKPVKLDAKITTPKAP